MTGKPMPSLAKICKQRSLSREREMACDSLALNTPITSN
ncbi:hypothetical protein CY0110_18247 [Crocosphaera chwakensis CCY0110]|uniref:Uncharacterized protein n=1 Tax=Crocosphaera chwakensis CCY0110 TaxID=391612 RepID=A3IIY1_9CHRO|nr:hypothetical protein CY0110_18247 [Crocosphaera chwakensis CCY0110]